MGFVLIMRLIVEWVQHKQPKQSFFNASELAC
jgi:hypothetical protein